MTFDLLATSNGTGEGLVQYPPPAAPGPPPTDEGSPLDDWQKAHAALMVRERAFADVLARHGQGQASLHELELAWDQLKALGELTDTLRQRALGAAGVRLLQAACELVGGEEQLARRLEMSVVLLGKYMAGSDELPEPLLRRTMDLLVQERKPQFPPVGKGVPDCG